MNKKSHIALIAISLSLPWLAAGCGVTSVQKEVDWYKQQLTLSEQDRNRLELELAQCEGEQKGWADRTSEIRNQLDRTEEELVALRREQGERALEPIEIRRATSPDPGNLEDFSGIEGVEATRGADDEIRLTVDQQILFSAGSTSIRASGRTALVQIAEVIGRSYRSHQIQVEGHTDNTPPTKIKARYPTNWELSTARASVVLRALNDTGKVDASRCVAVGYAEQRPVADNTSDEGRRKNRRVEVVVLPR
jgi:chemotaxis protein MotB